MIKINEKTLEAVLLTSGIIIILVIGSYLRNSSAAAYYGGGTVLLAGSSPEAELSVPVLKRQSEDYSERFQRPSKKLPLPNSYTFQSYSQSKNQNQFKQPEDVIFAYYGVLKEASNMAGFSGGCGTIGNANSPYPYAYEMLTPEVREKKTLQQFEDSFQGIGHITFLQLHPMPKPSNAPEDEMYYMVEIEIITGPKAGDRDYKDGLSYFAYYYGTVTVKKVNGYWFIQKIDYLPEEFLCAPYHSWFYDANAVVQIVHMNNLKIVEKITDTVEKDGITSIYAYGNGNQYRFDFVRLTNGHDILISENIKKDGKWVSTDLLTDSWKNLKLSVTTGD